MAQEVSITLSIGGLVKSVNPIFGDDVKMKYTREEGQAFLRSKIDGKVKFSREDFDFIESASHGTTFTLSVYLGSSLFGSCTFLKSDCTFNYDDKCCTVKIQTTDRYEKFLANYDNKYNLPQLAPATQALTLNKRPVLQFYFLRDKKITNVYGNMSFEVDARSGSENLSMNQMSGKGFGLLYWLKVIDIPTPSVAGISGIKGRYKGTIYGPIQSGTQVWREDNQYFLEYQYISAYATYAWQLYNANATPYSYNGNYVWVTEPYYDEYSDYQCGVKYGTDYAGSGSSQVAIADGHNRILYARALSDFSGTYTGETKTAMNTITDDVAEDNYNYLYAWTVQSFGIENKVVVSETVQTSPTEWGQDGNGKYFVRPTPSSPTNAVYPIGWSMWIPFSIWFESSTTLDDSLRSAFNTTYQLPDAYPLHSVIQKLLEQVNPNISFAMTATNSQFFYNFSEGLHKAIDSPALRNGQLYITPITNVKKTRYEQAAQRGDITLKQVLDMLKAVYQCYWYIDDSNRLRIEHIAYFKNNHSYALGNPTVDEDVTVMKDMPNGKMWTFGTNEIEFERTKCPSRYEFAWGGDCTEQFNGYAIDVLDKFASAKTKEKISVTNFTADIDYTVINPGGVSDDIYALIEANSSYAVQIPSIGLPSTPNAKPVYQMQNGYCSLLWAEQKRYVYDFGGWYAYVQYNYIKIFGVRQAKKQGIKYPTTLAKVGTTGTVKTGMGIGLIDEQDVNADTLYTDTKVMMEIERDFSNDVFTINISSHIGIRNNTDYALQVRYLKTNNTIATVNIGANSSYDTGSSSAISILSATQQGWVQFGELITRTGGAMTRTISNSASGATIVIKGNSYTGGVDWAYIKIKCEKRTRINMTASSESSYDIGYVGTMPYTSKSEITNNALGYVSGTGAQQVIVDAGFEGYIGYTKDSSSVANSDKITFEIEVPE